MEQNFLSPWIDILKHPREQSIKFGDQLMLICKADGKPSPLHFQWFCNAQVLPEQEANILMIPHTSSKDSGKYKCRVSNGHVTEWSNEVMVLVGSLPTDKIALLIGNQSYLNDNQLSASVNDVIELSRKLEKIGYKTFVFVDLTYNLMLRVLKWFFSLLSPQAYCFVYFAGHGFENGESYMVPIDAPPKYQSHHCFSVNYILQGVQKYDLSLMLLCLDTCRKFNLNEQYAPQLHSTERGYPNVVISHATTMSSEAYELKDQNISVYAKYLTQHITNDDFVLKMLADVHQAINTDPHTNGKQIAEMRTTLCQPRKLTDVMILSNKPNVVAKSTDYYNIWKLLQRQEHKNYILQFGIGVLVDLSFSLPAYNILRITARLRETLKNMEFRFMIFLPNDTQHACSCKSSDNTTLYINCLSYSGNNTSVKITLRILCKGQNGKVLFEDFSFVRRVPIPKFHTI